MAGLLADGWFYISSAGLLVSGALFFFLLGHYRAAVDAADQPETEAAPPPPAPLVRPLSMPEEPAPSATVASVSDDMNVVVAYLQNIKTQLADLNGETKNLAKRVDELSGLDAALSDRLGDIARAVAELKGARPPAPDAKIEIPAPAPADAPVAEPAPAAIEPKPEPAAASPAELFALPAAPSPEPEAGEKTRRGPVWPV